MNEKAVRNLKLAGEAIGAAASAAKVAAGIVQIGKPEDIAVVICVAAAASTVAAAHHVATNMAFVPAFTLKSRNGTPFHFEIIHEQDQPVRIMCLGRGRHIMKLVEKHHGHVGFGTLSLHTGQEHSAGTCSLGPALRAFYSELDLAPNVFTAPVHSLRLIDVLQVFVNTADGAKQAVLSREPGADMWRYHPEVRFSCVGGPSRATRLTACARVFELLVNTRVKVA